MKVCVLKPPGFMDSSEMQNDDLLHREGLEGYNGFICLSWVEMSLSPHILMTHGDFFQITNSRYASLSDFQRLRSMGESSSCHFQRLTQTQT